MTSKDAAALPRRSAMWVVWWAAAAVLAVVVPVIVGFVVHEHRAREARDAQQDRITCVVSDIERGPRTGRLCSDLAGG